MGSGLLLAYMMVPGLPARGRGEAAPACSLCPPLELLTGPHLPHLAEAVSLSPGPGRELPASGQPPRDELASGCAGLIFLKACSLKGKDL